jgi:hypothetical protein
MIRPVCGLVVVPTNTNKQQVLSLGKSEVDFVNGVLVSTLDKISTITNSSSDSPTSTNLTESSASSASLIANNVALVNVQTSNSEIPGRKIEIVPIGLYLYSVYLAIGSTIVLWGRFFVPVECIALICARRLGETKQSRSISEACRC